MNVTDHGQWMIVHPGELMATFLLPLPDPIALQDGTALPTYRWPIGQAGVQMLEPWLDELWLQGLDGQGSVPCDVMRMSSGDHTTPINWSNKCTLVASIAFHQTFSDAGIRLGLEPAMRLAKIVSGPRLTADEKARALDKSSVSGHHDEPRLREIGLGAATVAECAVGLRIVCEPPEMESPLAPGNAPEPLVGPREADLDYPDDITMWPWRIFPASAEPDTALIERRMRNALKIVLDELRSIQRTVHALRRTPTTMITLERLPVVVPVVLRRASDIGDSSKAPSFVLMPTRPTTVEALRPPRAAHRRGDGGLQQCTTSHGRWSLRRTP